MEKEKNKKTENLKLTPFQIQQFCVEFDMTPKEVEENYKRFLLFSEFTKENSKRED